MIASRFEELIAWQPASELEEEVIAFTSRPSTARDFKYCDQIREAARSAPRNTAEGFGRFYPKEFLYFLRIAAGSLNETKNQLHEGLRRRYMSRSEHERLLRLNLRALKANLRLGEFLETAKPPKRRRKRTPSREP
jgi:four helix bundle protein